MLKPDSISGLKSVAVASTPIVAGTLAFTATARRCMGHPNTWNQVQTTLDILQRELFEDEKYPFHHRITLFKHCMCHWPRGASKRGSVFWPWGRGRWSFSGWLVPVARSGHAHKKGGSSFLAPDDVDAAEGMAGEVWKIGGSGVSPPRMEDLPDLTVSSSGEERDAYCQAGMVSRQWLDRYLARGRLLPRSLAGWPIERNNRLWGVMVADSRNPKLPSPQKMNRAALMAARLLGSTLKGT